MTRAPTTPPNTTLQVAARRVAATAKVGPLRLECNDDDFRQNLVYAHVASKQNDEEEMTQLEVSPHTQVNI